MVHRLTAECIKICICSLILGEYTTLIGKWGVGASVSTYHSSLLVAKRSCLSRENCFGVRFDSINGKVYSITFPVRMEPGGNWFMHKKEISLGI